MKIAAYYKLVKPGIIYGNLITGVAGYLLASGLKIYFASFISMAIGMSLVMGSACVVNNLMDRDIDSKMDRTKRRPSVSGEISRTSGAIYSATLAIIGFILIFVFVNKLCALVGLIGFIDYAVIYTYLKKRTYHATLIGSLAGAAPIVGGYVAYSDNFNLTALVIGIMMAVWQMPHFYAISIYREKDYRKAKIPVMSITSGKMITARWMVFYSFIFLISSVELYLIQPSRLFYLIVMSLVSMIWLGFNISGLKRPDIAWARKSFFLSLMVMLVMSFMIAIN